MPKILLLVIVCLLLIGTGLELHQYYRHQYVLGLAIARDVKTQKLIQEIDYWQKIASASPTYKDAYVQLAILNQDLGDTAQAKVWMQKALTLDPNWLVPTPLQPLLPWLRLSSLHPLWLRLQL